MPRIAKPKIDIPKDAFFKYTVNGRILAKVVEGRVLCANRVITNTKAGIESWQEFASIEEASKRLGVPPPEHSSCPIIDDEHPPIDWATYKGGYYIRKSE